MHTDFLRGRSGGLVVPSLEEFSTVYFDPHNQRLGSKLGLGLVNKAVNKAEIDVFLEFSCFFCDPTDVGNLNSGSSAGFRKGHPIEEGEKGMGMDYPLGLPGHQNHCGW